VLIEGEDITEMSTASCRACGGGSVLFQNAALFDSISVGGNVAFPLQRHTMDRASFGRVNELLLAVGLAHGTRCRRSLGRHAKQAGLARALALAPRFCWSTSPARVSSVTAGGSINCW
jgi:phospholipid/cholesterol/gamma-HCH transport system ATP-binding protein